MAEPYTDADVALATDAVLNLPEPCEHYAPLGADFACDECKVRAALSALAAAGRLIPAGGRTRTEYNLRFRNGSGRWIVDEDLTSSHEEDDWAHTRRLFGADVHQVSRTVTKYPDGSYLVGPWLPAEPAPLVDRLGDTWASPVTATGFDTEEDTNGR